MRSHQLERAGGRFHPFRAAFTRVPERSQVQIEEKHSLFFTVDDYLVVPIESSP